MFFAHTTPVEFKNTTNTGHFRLVFEENVAAPSFTKRSVLKLFSVHTISKSWRFKFLRFVLLHFCDGLVWTVGLTVEIKLRFQIPPAYRGRGRQPFEEISLVVKLLYTEMTTSIICIHYFPVSPSLQEFLPDKC